jgi:hypothetical protein
VVDSETRWRMVRKLKQRGAEPERPVSIRNARLEDLPAIKDLYNYFIRNTVVTFDDKPLLREGHGKNLDSQLWDFLFGSLMAFFLLRHVIFKASSILGSVKAILGLLILALRPVVLACTIIWAAISIAEVVVFDVEYSPAKAVSRIIASAACAHFMFAILTRCPSDGFANESPGSIAPLFALALGYFLVWFIAKLLTIPCMRTSRVETCRGMIRTARMWPI